MAEKISFLRDRRGNFSVMFAIGILPVIGAVGLAVDYSNMLRDRNQLQLAVDSAVLSASSSYFRTGTLPPAEAVERQISANFGGEFNVTRYVVTNEQIHISASTRTPTFLMHSFGQDRMAQEVDATAPVGVDNFVEIVLVLDTTASMSVDGKMDALQRTAGTFVENALTFAPASQPDAVRIGIVPYADYVNVGISRRNEAWLDAPADESTTTCSTYRPVISQSDCTTTTENIPAQYVPEQCSGPTFNDGVQVAPRTCTPGRWQEARTQTNTQCATIEYGDPVEQCTTHTREWKGCVGSRPPALNVRDQAFANRVPGLLDLECTTPITPLTIDGRELTAAIDALTPYRETYIGTGVSWGTRVLSRRAPFTEAENPSDKLKKFMILMSDGDNTRAPERGANMEFHTNSDTDYADDQTIKACNEAKRDDIEIFTIAFGETISDAGKRVLQQCASDPDSFFDASDAARLQQAFDSIAQSIFRVRLSS